MSRERLFAWLQECLPHHLLSRLVGRLAESRCSWIKDPFIRLFIRRYGVDMREALEEDPRAYSNFNAFFTRALKPDARPLVAADDQLACPADGAISQLGDIDYGRVFQAKGHSYSLTSLLGGDPKLAESFIDGKFATIYLSPRDYHRVHMPITGTLKEMIYVPGRLYSVNQATTRQVPNLFARNERLVCVFDTPAGPMAMILVGAMIVAGIETVWAGQAAPHLPRVERTGYGGQQPAPITLPKGAEMGRFKLGSTVILLFGKDAIDWRKSLAADSPTRQGEGMGRIRTADGVQDTGEHSDA